MHISLGAFMLGVLLLMVCFMAGLIGLSIIAFSVYLAGIFIGFAILAVLLGTIRRLLNKLKIRGYQTVVSEFEAPHMLEAAELGYLFDNRSKNLELLATLLVLVRKGVVDISFNERKDPLFVWRADSQAALTDIELTAQSYIRREKEVAWQHVGEGLSSALTISESFDNEVKYSLIAKGFVARPALRRLTAAKAFIMLGYLFIPLAIIWFYVYDGSRSPADYIDRLTVALLPVTCFLLVWPLCVQIFAWVYRQSAQLPHDLTQKARSHWRDIAGYKLFLETVEFNRLDADLQVHDPVLAYCVALGYKLNPKRLVKS